MDNLLTEFEAYLFQEKGMARNSMNAYTRDLRGFLSFLSDKHIESCEDVNNATVISYVLFLKKEGRTTATINRKIASVRAFFNFLIRRGDIRENPVSSIKAPRVEKKNPEYLTLEEVETLLAQPDDTKKGIRDRGILELMYATGMRVSEIIMLDVEDINLKMGFAACSSEKGSGRIIPIGGICRQAIEIYLSECRSEMVKDSGEKALFVNYSGSRLTRQGLWKIIKYYAEKAGIKKRITPRILRHSFAVHMIKNGADLKSLQELLGHVGAAATQVYLMDERTGIREVYDKAHPRAGER